MKNVKSRLAFKSTVALTAGAVFLSLCFAGGVSAQRGYSSAGTIEAGTNITVRTNEAIEASDSDGRVFTGVVEQDVAGRNRTVAIPRGSDVELSVKRLSDHDVALDLDSVTINGRRYGVDTEENVVGAERKDGIGANERTGKYVGGGAVLGAIIGAIAGGGKGAAIGAGAGAAAGAGTQVLTKGQSVKVPAESLLTFRLAQPLRAGAGNRDGRRYRSEGADNGGRQQPGNFRDDRASVNIGADKNVSWQGPPNATPYVQADNEAPKVFASGPSGRTAAPWMTPGHVYVFILKDAKGNEVARDQQDLRELRRR